MTDQATPTEAPEAAEAAPEITPAPPAQTQAPVEPVKWNGMVPMEARPDGVPDKYWDAKANALRLEGMVKSLTESQRKITELTTPLPAKAPETYEFRPPEHLKAYVDGDAPLFERATAWAKENDIPQDAFDKLVETFYGDLPTVETLTKSLEGEYGTNAGAVIEANAKWLATVRDPAMRDAFDTLMLTPDGHKALAWVRERIGGGRAIQETTSTPAPTKSWNDVLSMKQDPRYWRERDPVFVKEVGDLIAALFPGEQKTAISMSNESF